MTLLLLDCPLTNHIYFILQKLPKVGDFCRHLCSGLKELRVSYLKTIIFARATVILVTCIIPLKFYDGSHFTEPYGYPTGLHQFRLVNMYTRASTKEMIMKQGFGFVCFC